MSDHAGNPPKTWIVVPYDPEWPAMFAREAKILEEIFAGTGSVVEHMGSTSVPGLGAKPIIDITIGVPALAVAEARIDRLREFQYEYVPEYEAELPMRRYFRKPFVRPRSHHLHIVELGSTFWREHLAFRDYLRSHPDVADAYYKLKVELAAECTRTGADYPAGKASFVADVVASAMSSLEARPRRR
jgi:GrpB-like predicted nucleotidyltransferase (UPF0157 family)